VWDGAALAVATSVAAWLGTFPIILFNFGKFSIWTAAANLVMFPIMDLWMLLGFLLLIATLFQAVFGWTFLLVPVFLGHARAIAAIEWPAHFFSLLPMSFKNIPQTSVAAILVMYCGIASLLLWRRLRWMRYATAAVMIVAAVVVVWPLAAEAQTGEFEITVLDVGHGGATFIRFPDGRTVLYDCGSYRESDVARRIIQPFLRERGITHLDAVIISHPHVDHFDGLPTLLENYRVKTLVLTDYFTPDVNKYWAAVWPAIQDSGARIVRMKDGGTLDGFPELSFILAKVSLPPRESENYNATLNETSLVTRVECDGLSLLLTGDIEEQGIAWFNSRYNGPPVDVLVSPHHGDYESHDLTVTMMKKLRPRAVIVSTDRRMIKESLRSAIEKKESGKPASATGPAGDTTRIYLTRASGAITIKTNSKTTYVHETLKQEN
jgi:competence protein ComEC